MSNQTKTTWRKVRIGELVAPISETFNFDKRNEIVFLNTSDVENGEVLTHKRIIPKNLPGQAKKSIKRGDILYSEIRPQNKHFARINFDADDYVVSTKLMVLRPSNQCSSDFAYLVLTAPRTIKDFQTIAEARSGTFPQITFDAIKEYEILAPDNSTHQQLVADSILSYDKKIDFNNKISRTLEEMTQEIFKEWFVNFKFPGHEKVKMVNSELGKIPEGWEVKRFEDIMEFLNGEYIPNLKYNSKGEYTIYGSNSIMGRSDKYLYEGPVIIIAKIGSYCGAIRYSQIPCWINNNAGGIKGKKVIPTSFIYYLLKRFNFNQVREGSGQPFVNMKGLREQKTVFPSPQFLDLFKDNIDKIMLYMFKIENENQKLSALRDLLLPKLMSGEIKV